LEIAVAFAGESAATCAGAVDGASEGGIAARLLTRGSTGAIAAKLSGCVRLIIKDNAG
jgi:hypothetical protein